MPMPGDVDVVLASELMEAARAVERGFVTPDRTTLLIASTHRVYAMTEKIALADGRGRWRRCSRAAARRRGSLVAFDMAALADATGSVVSAVLFGALAGSGALPFPRTAFEAAIRRGQVGVAKSLAAFGAGFEAAQAAQSGDALRRLRRGRAPCRRDPRWRPHRGRGRFFRRARAVVRAGLERLADYQDAAYAREFLARLEPFARSSASMATAPAGCWRKRRASSRSPWPTRTRSGSPTSRSGRAASRGCARRCEIADGQILEIAEFLHPHAGDRRYAARAARTLAPAHALGARILDRFTAQGTDRQDHVGRRLPPALRLSRLKPLRRRSLRFAKEQRCAGWLGLVARDRAQRLCAGGRGRAHARPGEGLWRHPRARADEVRQDWRRCCRGCARVAMPPASSKA